MTDHSSSATTAAADASTLPGASAIREVTLRMHIRGAQILADRYPNVCEVWECRDKYSFLYVAVVDDTVYVNDERVDNYISEVKRTYEKLMPDGVRVSVVRASRTTRPPGDNAYCLYRR